MTAAEDRREDPEDLLAKVIALLAEAYREAQESRPRNLPPRRPVTAANALSAAHREMVPVAARLARAAARGDRKRANGLLDKPRTRGEWKALAMVLAAAADPARIEFTEGAGAQRELRRAS